MDNIMFIPALVLAVAEIAALLVMVRGWRKDRRAEVVRCKDCKWGCSPFGDEDDGWTACANIPGRPIFRDEHFCSSGESRWSDGP